MVAQKPDVSPPDAGVCGSLLPGGVEVEGLRSLSPLTGVERLEELGDLVLPEAGKGYVNVRSLIEFRQEPGQKLLVPVPADSVQGQVEELSLLRREVNEDDRDAGQAQTPCRQQSLVAADDGAVLPPGDDGVNESKFLDAPG